MKKNIKKPDSREEDLQAIIDFLVDNGVSDFSVNMLIHTNMPALGDDRSIMSCARNGEWNDAWNVAELYVSGDLF